MVALTVGNIGTTERSLRQPLRDTWCRKIGEKQPLAVASNAKEATAKNTMGALYFEN